MNLPNKLTLLRVLMIPVCLTLLAMRLYIWAAAVFAAACVTDWLDGYIARRDGLVTNFGKFADPVADKLLVLTAMVMLTSMEQMPAWVVCMVAARELAVDGLRLVMVEQGIVVAAKLLGKIKTNLQMIYVLWVMLLPLFGGVGGNLPTQVASVLGVLTALMTVWSGADYFVKAWPAMRDTHSKHC